MIDKAAILHIPCSEYAYPLDEETFCVRLRAGRRDLVSCELYVADRACETTPIRFEGLPMERIARDERFDFFQAVFPIRHTRLCYYFRLQGQEEWTYYYGDIFTRELADLQMEGNWVDGRSEYFQYPAILRTEIARPPATQVDEHRLFLQRLPGQLRRRLRGVGRPGEEWRAAGRHTAGRDGKSGAHCPAGVQRPVSESDLHRKELPQI